MAKRSKSSRGKRSKKKSKMKNLRILSVNACCLPWGMRNYNLPKHSVRSGVSLMMMLIALGTFGLYSYYSTFSGPVDSLNLSGGILIFVLYVFLSIYVGFLFGSQTAQFYGKIGTLLGLYGRDYKRERLEMLVEGVFVDYDIIGIQELFKSVPLSLDAGNVDFLIELSKAKGFNYCVRPKPAQWPSVNMNTGLLILSRFPIETSETFVFKNQFFSEQWAVNRGCLYARIRLPSSYDGYSEGKALHFFTLHACPGMTELLKGYPQFFLDAAERARNGQFKEFASIVENRWSKGNGRIVIAGDFNADITFKENKNKKKKGSASVANFKDPKDFSPSIGVAMQIILDTLVKRLGLDDVADGGFRPTFGYWGRDTLLTNPGQRRLYKTDDLIFSDSGGRNEDGKYDWKVLSLDITNFPKLKHWMKLGYGDPKQKPCTHLSDHRGVALVLPETYYPDNN